MQGKFLSSRVKCVDTGGGLSVTVDDSSSDSDSSSVTSSILGPNSVTIFAPAMKVHPKLHPKVHPKFY